MVGKSAAGAPVTPENTWFQTPFVQMSPSSLSRVIHCCCEPLIVIPSTFESAR